MDKIFPATIALGYTDTIQFDQYKRMVKSERMKLSTTHRT
jgi:hypothetical protein